jgi:5'-nucleotidase
VKDKSLPLVCQEISDSPSDSAAPLSLSLPQTGRESMSDREPLILVTNDDGVFAKGIISLVEAVKPLGRVVVVAPDKPQSGMGHAVTIHGILRVKKEKFPVEGVEAYSTTGTPVDCVKLAIYRILDRKPDILVSGINHGSNSSINVIYSGTMSAAMEGALEDIPSIGFSLLNFDADANFEAARHVASVVTAKALEKGIPVGYCLNVNIPDISFKKIKGLRVCRQAKAYWSDAFEPRKDPGGKEYFWLTGVFKNHDKGEDTDEWALANGYVSIVPTQYDLTAHHAISNINQWNLKL